jgi:hypothetical protein
MQRLLTVFIAIILLFIFGGGLMMSLASLGTEGMTPGQAAMTDMPIHAEHTAGSHHCPLMGPGENLCPMDMLGHLAFVRGLFEVLLPCFLLLLCVSTATLLCPNITPITRRHRLDSYHLTWRWRRWLLTTYFYRQYQDYFASGLLNPKYF